MNDILNSILLLPVPMGITIFFAIQSKQPITPKEHTDDSTAAARQKDCLNALADWSKWVIGLQSAFIGLVGLKLNGTDQILANTPFLIKEALISFVISILAATVLLATVPDGLRSLPFKPKSGSNQNKYCIYEYPTIGGHLPIASVAAIEHTLFISGVIFLTLGVVI